MRHEQALIESEAGAPSPKFARASASNQAIDWYQVEGSLVLLLGEQHPTPG